MMRPVNFLMNPIRLNRLEHDRAGNEDPPRQLTSPAPGAHSHGEGGEGQEGQADKNTTEDNEKVHT